MLAIVMVVITMMPIAHTSMTTNTALSEVEKSPSAQKLETDIERLEKRQSRWESGLKISLAIAAIAALGVFGFDFGSRRIGRRLHDRQAELNTVKDREYAADSKAKDLKIVEAGREAGDAIERAGKLAKEAEQLRKKAEDERLARVLIEQSLAWRSLSADDEQRLSNRLGHFRGLGFLISYNAGDSEGAAFAWDIAKALHKAKLNVSSPGSYLDLADSGHPFDLSRASLVTGIVVTSTNNGQSRLAADLSVQTLSDCGFDVMLNPTPNTAGQLTVWINIESRPRGPQGEAKLKLQATSR